MKIIKCAVDGIEESKSSVMETFAEQMKAFLESYRICRRICDSYKEEYGAGTIPVSEAEDRERIYRSCLRRCEQVKDFIESLNMDPERKKLLELHYLYGYTVERCADQLYLSRSTAFRIKKKAEASACALFFGFCDGKGGEDINIRYPESSLKMA